MAAFRGLFRVAGCRATFPCGKFAMRSFIAWILAAIFSAAWAALIAMPVWKWMTDVDNAMLFMLGLPLLLFSGCIGPAAAYRLAKKLPLSDGAAKSVATPQEAATGRHGERVDRVADMLKTSNVVAWIGTARDNPLGPPEPRPGAASAWTASITPIAHQPQPSEAEAVRMKAQQMKDLVAAEEELLGQEAQLAEIRKRRAAVKRQTAITDAVAGNVTELFIGKRPPGST